MSGVDQRIVEMKFNGDSFLNGVKNSLNVLKSLKEGLNNLKGGKKDINDLEDAGKKFSLSGMTKGIQDATSNLNLMKVAGLTVFTSLVHQALFAGENILKALTINPLKAGLDVYETKINAIQTILANTASEGTKLKDVTAALNQLNDYANKTVYNFGQMAKNIGTFTAAGVNLKESVASIKGIANLAALSGSSAEQASTAMYQLSQSIAAGKVNLQDWNSVVNAGLGGKVFQNQLIETARATGVNIDAIIKKAGSFRNSLQQGWLTSNILTKTLSLFTGDLSKAQIKAMGFTDKEANAILKQAQNAVDSATKIRTVTQLFDALKEEVATAWSRVFEAVIGNINQATNTLSALHNVAENALTTPINKLAELLTAFRKLGGFDLIIKGITNAFHAFAAILSTVKEAFRAVFPENGGQAAQGLLKMAEAFEKFTQKLEPSKKTLAELKTIFEGIFSVVKIVIDVVGAAIGGITKIGSAASGSSGGFLHLLSNLASLITKFKNLIESSGALTKFFQFLGTILSLPVKAIGLLFSGIGSLGTVFQKIVSFVSPIIQKIGSEFSKVGSAIVNGIKSGNFTNVGTILNQVLLGGLLLQVKKFMKSLTSSLGGGEKGPGLFDTIKESFEGLTNSLKAMQQNLKAGTLEKIAIAVAVLAASLLALSFVNIGNLTKALAAMTVMFTELLISLSVVSKIAGSGGVVKMAVIGVALNELATAILILTGAVAILAHFSWDQLTKGLAAIAILLAELSVAVKAMSGDTAGLITATAAMIGIATAMNIMALAVGQLGKLPFGTLAKGVGAIAALLLVVTGFQRIDGGEKLISSAAGMVLIGAALNVMAAAIKKLGGIPMGNLVKGIGAVAATLLVLVTAMNAMKSGIGGGAALTIAAAGLLILSKAISSLGAESWGAIGKALVALAASLLLMQGAMLAMQGAIGGAAALLVMSAALAVLTGVLVILGNLSWDTIVKGLVALAGIFAVLGAAGLLLAPVTPIILALGVAVGLIGIGVLAAAAGLLVFAAAITALGVAVVAVAASIIALIKLIISLPAVVINGIVNAIASIVKTLGAAISTIVNAFVGIFSSVLDAITKLVPKFVNAVTAIVNGMVHIITVEAPKLVTAMLQAMQSMLNAINKYLPKFAAGTVQLITNMLNAIASKIPAMGRAAANLILTFINTVTTQTVRVVNAGLQMVIKMINGIANGIRSQTPQLQQAMRNLGSAIIQAITGAITGGLSAVVGSITNVVKGAINAAKKLLEINSPSKVFMAIFKAVPEGAALGVTNNAHLVDKAVDVMTTSAIKTVGKSLSSMGKIIADGIDLQPKITPVIDLTQLKAGISKIPDISGSPSIKAVVSASNAASISASNAAAAANAGLVNSNSPVQLNFTQNNNSPVALDAVTIYRQTKNQLSITRGALTRANAG